MVVAAPTVYQINATPNIAIQQVTSVVLVPVVYNAAILVVNVATIGILSSQG